MISWRSHFIPAILNQKASSHFSLPKFHMYNGLQDPFNHLLHNQQIITLRMGNDALLCKVFPSSLASLALSWFHSLALTSMTFFHRLREKFVSQYMCSMQWKQSVTSLFHVRMERSKTIRDFMKPFGAALLHLDSVNPDTAL